MAKRKILCPACGIDRRRIQNQYLKDEGHRSLWSVAREDRHCDLCGRMIATGGPCYADTAWTKKKEKIPDHWEKEFVDVIERSDGKEVI
jgi:hypothetical protein